MGTGTAWLRVGWHSEALYVRPRAHKDLKSLQGR